MVVNGFQTGAQAAIFLSSGEFFAGSPKTHIVPAFPDQLITATISAPISSHRFGG